MTSKVHKVLIVEDEALLRQNIVQKVQEFSSSFEVVGSAGDGAEALELMEKSRPDIVISDIVMPVMNGIEFIRVVREKYPWVQVAVLSGYDDFNYLKAIMEMGVRDYLLKPLSTGELYEVLLKFSNNIDFRLNPHANHSLHMLLNSQPTSELTQNFENTKFFLAVAFGGNCDYRIMNQELEDFFHTFWRCITFDDIFGNASGSMPSPLVYNSIHPNEKYLLFEYADVPEAMFHAYLKEAYGLLNKNSFGMPISVSYAAAPVSAQALYDTAASIKNHFYSHYCPWQPQAFCIVNAHRTGMMNKQVKAVALDSIMKHFQSGSMAFARQELFSVLQSWYLSCIKVNQFIKNLQFILFSLRRYAPQLNEAAFGELIGEVEYSFATSGSFERFFSDFYDILLNYFFTGGEDNTIARIIEQVKAYLDENFNQPLQLFDIAKRFNISSSYLVRHFKLKYGKSPINYLILLRINEAKELMTKFPDMEIKTISELIGYTDQHYFSKFFKKHIGLAPSEYRESITTQAAICGQSGRNGG